MGEEGSSERGWWVVGSGGLVKPRRQGLEVMEMKLFRIVLVSIWMGIQGIALGVAMVGLVSLVGAAIGYIMHLLGL